jgi:hypothetical protein
VVQQEEIDVVDAEPQQAAVEAGECLIVAVVADPELGDDEDLVAVDRGASDPLADLALVAVGGGRVDERVAVRDRGLDRARRLLRRALEDAEPGRRASRRRCSASGSGSSLWSMCPPRT